MLQAGRSLWRQVNVSQGTTIAENGRRQEALNPYFGHSRLCQFNGETIVTFCDGGKQEKNVSRPFSAKCAANLRQNGKSRPVARKYFPGCGGAATTSLLSDGEISFSDEFDDATTGKVAW